MNSKSLNYRLFRRCIRSINHVKLLYKARATMKRHFELSFWQQLVVKRMYSRARLQGFVPVTFLVWPQFPYL